MKSKVNSVGGEVLKNFKQVGSSLVKISESSDISLNKNMPYLDSFDVRPDILSNGKIKLLKNLCGGNFGVSEIPIIDINQLTNTNNGVENANGDNSEQEDSNLAKLTSLRLISYPELIFESDKGGALILTIGDQRCLLCYGGKDELGQKQAGLYIVNDFNHINGNLPILNENGLPEQSLKHPFPYIFTPIYSWVASKEGKIVPGTVSNQLHKPTEIQHRVCYGMGGIFNTLINELIESGDNSKESNTKKTGLDRLATDLSFDSAERTLYSFLKVILGLNDSVNISENYGIITLNKSVFFPTDFSLMYRARDVIILNNTVSQDGKSILLQYLGNKYLLNTDKDNLYITNVSFVDSYNEANFSTYGKYSVVSVENGSNLVNRVASLKSVFENVLINGKIVKEENLTKSGYKLPASGEMISTKLGGYGVTIGEGIVGTNIKSKLDLDILGINKQKIPIIATIQDNKKVTTVNHHYYDKEGNRQIFPQDVNDFENGIGDTELTGNISYITHINGYKIANCAHIAFTDDGRVYGVCDIDLNTYESTTETIQGVTTKLADWQQAIFVIDYPKRISDNGKISYDSNYSGRLITSIIIDKNNVSDEIKIFKIKRVKHITKDSITQDGGILINAELESPNETVKIERMVYLDEQIKLYKEHNLKIN